MTYVKICGISKLEHGLCALEAGADSLGFVFAPSRRQVSPERAAELVAACRRRFPPAQRPWLAVGVFANQPLDFVLGASALAALDIVQLSGNETPEYCRGVGLPLYRAVHVPTLVLSPQSSARSTQHAALSPALAALRTDCGAARLLLDSGGAGRWGGTGETFPWEWIGGAAGECIVAGGLDPGNVAEAVAAMRPWGVDVSSGVERDGRKDPDLIRRFIMEVRGSCRRDTTTC